MNFRDQLISLKKKIVIEAPEILTVAGVASFITTIVLSVKATPKAVAIINTLEEEPTKTEIVKATWKCYIPTAIAGTVSIGCFVGAIGVTQKRNTSLMAACKIAESALREYKDAVIETVSEKEEKQIRYNMADKKIRENPVSNTEVIITGSGDTLCYDSFSGRYFESNIDKIRKAENTIDRMILTDDYASLNDFYDELGLDRTRGGDELGWRSDRGFIRISLGSHISEDGRPCISITFGSDPMYDFDTLY